MKLLLTSQGLPQELKQTFLDCLTKPPRENKAVFITTAAYGEGEYRPEWLDIYKNQLQNYGIKDIKELDIKGKNIKDLEKILSDKDIIFVKIAIKNTFPQNTTFTLLIENTVIIFGLLPFLYFRDRNFLDQMFNNTKLFVLLGLLNAVATILAFSAVGEGNVGFVKTLMQTEILFVLLFSFFFFKDKPRKETIIGSLVMIIGVVLIKIAS